MVPAEILRGRHVSPYGGELLFDEGRGVQGKREKYKKETLDKRPTFIDFSCNLMANKTKVKKNLYERLKKLNIRSFRWADEGFFPQKLFHSGCLAETDFDGQHIRFGFSYAFIQLFTTTPFQMRLLRHLKLSH